MKGVDDMKIVPISPPKDRDDVVKGLRNIADDIEAGEYDFTPTIAVIVLADEQTTKGGEDDHVSYNLQTHALGERRSYFMHKGILTEAAGSMI